jgi:hypothetical protein
LDNGEDGAGDIDDGDYGNDEDNNVIWYESLEQCLSGATYWVHLFPKFRLPRDISITLNK